MYIDTLECKYELGETFFMSVLSIRILKQHVQDIIALTRVHTYVHMCRKMLRDICLKKRLEAFLYKKVPCKKIYRTGARESTLNN